MGKLSKKFKKAKKDFSNWHQANKDDWKASRLSRKREREEGDVESLEEKMRDFMAQIQTKTGEWTIAPGGSARYGPHHRAYFKLGAQAVADGDKDETKPVIELKYQTKEWVPYPNPRTWEQRTMGSYVTDDDDAANETAAKEAAATRDYFVKTLKEAAKKEKAEKKKTPEEEDERLKNKKDKIQADVKKTKEELEKSDVGSLLMLMDERDKKKKKINEMKNKIDELWWNSENPTVKKRIERAERAEKRRREREFDRNWEESERRWRRGQRAAPTGFGDFLAGNWGGGKRRKSRRKPRRKPRRKTKRGRKPRRKTKRRRKSKRSKSRRR